ncbi:Polysaccharide pyruvyl transferase [uncultured Bacteroides sp.]|uniref:polysaccharide pyruvyl transferase family protein n=1 Tax=Bacteroides cellulolyticus TaxID=2981780 RepID=UPI0008224FA7|nr:polysaccharide pyruvyl transferase family protein [Bacteroides cellulolyticus]MCU6770348.1 polysaccharide pyruvyl transferase family protein [Bacteroides cellulolyticus]SCH06477.1 Polysaccharide pyruvyl transferase [uncultured Bacteroides sp.]
MKYKLLSVSTEKQVNIGDYIQALASSQFLPKVDGFIQRELLKEYNGDECKIIMNGWYMHNPNQWPPSEKINPLFVAFHINSLTKDLMLSDESIDYFKKNEPIGCRDLNTMNILQERGVNAYFSACMTLTLGHKYKSEEKEKKCYFVDPFFIKKNSLSSKLYNLFYITFHWRTINHIAKKFHTNNTGIQKKISVSLFYRQYKKIFTKKTLLEAEYISQQNRFYKENLQNDEERLSVAEELVKKYSKAALVVTSRIHCALPCLGLETPVIYIYNSEQSEASKCRLGGLEELFNIIRLGSKGFIKDFTFNDKISIENFPKNKNTWKEYADKLIKRAYNFTK